MVDYESKFLDEEYLAVRLRDFKEIKNKEVGFHIKKSNRETSCSLYIEFYINGSKRCEMRISDHEIPHAPQLQFIVNPAKVLSKKKKEQFVRSVETCIRKAHVVNVVRTIKYMEKKLDNEN